MTMADTQTPDLFRMRPLLPDGVPPEICDLFERLALQVREAGLKQYSARAILHRMRWHEQVERGREEFKINNKHSAPLARWFLVKHPELPDFFELRKSPHE